MGGLAGYEAQKVHEQANFTTSKQSGTMDRWLEKWNENYFQPLGLYVLIDEPQVGGSIQMDVASTKLYKYQQRRGITSAFAGAASDNADRKECKYQRREGRQRMKATMKARIVILPFDMVKAACAAVERKEARTPPLQSAQGGDGPIPSSVACTHTQEGSGVIVEGEDGNISIAPMAQCHGRMGTA